ncbi:MAG: MFS transporter [Deinococcales bacterium]
MKLLPRYPAFSRLWLAGAISQVGDKFNDLAIPIFVYSLTDSAWHLGLVGFVASLAIFIFGLIAGVVSDRLPRRPLMISADIVRLMVFLGLALLAYSELPLNITLICLYVAAFISSAADQFAQPSRYALITQMVDKDDLMQANALDHATTNIAAFIGFASAGITIEIVGVSMAFLLDA